MATFKVFLMLALLMPLAITLSAAVGEEESSVFDHETTNDDDETKSSFLLRGRSGRFLRTRLAVATCDKYPRVCRASGSAGPDCCQKKCVDKRTDRGNCGKCGRKCKYGETCCKGKCVNPRSDKRHCGSCNNKCKKGSKCVYGMCSYA